MTDQDNCAAAKQRINDWIRRLSTAEAHRLAAASWAARLRRLASDDPLPGEPSQPQEPARGDGATMPLADWVV